MIRFAEFMKAKREALGLTQAELAVRVFGRSDYQGYISKIENKKKSPQEDNMIAILEAMGCKIVYTE
ncbi:MAG TPA: helix-turn-helix transcriptional regulator [Flavobacterium sp.]|nr:helix-turn-helix transcriptional regulator [Flavobacterium sp.]